MQVAKQVIVMRKDLGMRKGKMIAQGAHASVGVIFKIQEYLRNGPKLKTDAWEKWRPAYESWFTGQFTKICVGVNSEEELMQIFGAAQQAELPVFLVTDAGHTEFHGIPTRTCLAIGPAWTEEVDKITGKLELL